MAGEISVNIPRCTLPSPPLAHKYICLSSSLFISSILPPFTSRLTQLTLAVLGLRLHLLQTFQHAPQVSDAILKGDFLILAGMGIFQQLPHVDFRFLFFRPLVPARQIVVREMGDYYY